MAWLDPRKSGWYLRDRPKVCIALGKLSKQDAKNELRRYEIEKGENGPHAGGNAKTESVLKEYLAELEQSNYSEKTLRTKRQNLGYFIATVKRMGDITREHITWWKAEMFKQGLALDTVALRLRDLRAWLNWCHKEGRLRTSIPIQIPEGRKDAGRDLSKKELSDFLAYIAKARAGRRRIEWSDTLDQVRLATILYFYSGCRLSEALNADFSDFDRQRAIWHIPKAKGDKRREVPLHHSILKALPKRKDGLLFSMSDKPIRYWWAKAARSAGVKGRFRIHDARHNFASYFMRSTGDWMALMEICGWSSAAMAKRYTHLGKDHLVEKINAISF